MSGNARRRNATAAIALTVLAGGALLSGLPAQSAASQGKGKRTARATLVNAAGETIGAVRFERRGKSRAVQVYAFRSAFGLQEFRGLGA